MIVYRDRSSYKVKLSNKLIKEDYKVWIFDDVGYMYDWLWHSYIEESEVISQEDIEVDRVTKKEFTELNIIHLTSTFILVIYLVQRLHQIYSTYVFYFFLNNLFLKVNVVQSLLVLYIYCTDTIYKNVQEILT